jgi:D-psicose/D-tagatose/L-ribulose 3-epimerase
MKIGFNLLYWTTFLSEDQFGYLDQLKQIGYDGVEIPVFSGSTEQYEAIGKALKNSGLAATAVTVIPDQAHSPISENPEDRKRAFDYFQWAIDCCQAAGGETLIGPFYQPLGIFTGEPPTGDERKRAAEVHREAAEYADAARVALAVEPLNRFECYFLNTLDQAAEYVEQVGHPNFHTMFDTFHANMEEKDPVLALRRNLGSVRHVHISENDRGAPGSGHVPWDGVFDTLVEGGYDRWLTIEAFSRALPDLAAVARVWREFDPPEAVYEGGYRFIRDQLAARR